MLRTFLVVLFCENERLYEQFKTDPKDANQPFTDDELEALVRDQLKDDPTILSSLDSTPAFHATSRIRIWRSEYNRGVWAVKPQMYSFRYSKEGQPCNRKEASLSPEKIVETILSFKFPDPRKESHVSSLKETQ